MVVIVEHGHDIRTLSFYVSVGLFRTFQMSPLNSAGSVGSPPLHKSSGIRCCVHFSCLPFVGPVCKSGNLGRKCLIQARPLDVETHHCRRGCYRFGGVGTRDLSMLCAARLPASRMQSTFVLLMIFRKMVNVTNFLENCHH